MSAEHTINIPLVARALNMATSSKNRLLLHIRNGDDLVGDLSIDGVSSVRKLRTKLEKLYSIPDTLQFLQSNDCPIDQSCESKIQINQLLTDSSNIIYVKDNKNQLTKSPGILQ
jgi:hypothetical protein